MATSGSGGQLKRTVERKGSQEVRLKLGGGKGNAGCHRCVPMIRQAIKIIGYFTLPPACCCCSSSSPSRQNHLLFLRFFVVAAQNSRKLGDLLIPALQTHTERET